MTDSSRRSRVFPPLLVILTALWIVGAAASGPTPQALRLAQTSARSGQAPSDGCLTCHVNAKDPHPVAQSLTCVDCHGGNGTATTKQDAHPRPAFPDVWKSSGNPHATFTLLNHERHEWIR